VFLSRFRGGTKQLGRMAANVADLRTLGCEAAALPCVWIGNWCFALPPVLAVFGSFMRETASAAR